MGLFDSVGKALFGNGMDSALGGMMDNSRDSLDFAKDSYQSSMNYANQAINSSNEQFEYFNSIFGDPIDNYFNYVDNLNPEDFAIRMNTMTREQFQSNMNSVKAYAAKSGVNGSGTTSALMARTGIESSKQMAQNNFKAEEYVYGMKRDAANTGVNAMSQAFASKNNAYGTAINTNLAGTSQVMAGYGNVNSAYGSQINAEMAEAQGVGQLIGYGLSAATSK